MEQVEITNPTKQLESFQATDFTKTWWLKGEKIHSDEIDAGAAKWLYIDIFLVEGEKYYVRMYDNNSNNRIGSGVLITKEQAEKIMNLEGRPAWDYAGQISY